MESIQAALGPLADFTDMLSAENFVTVSALNPVLHVLASQVLVRKEQDTNLTKEIKTRTQDYLEKKSIAKDRIAREGAEMGPCVTNAQASSTAAEIAEEQLVEPPPKKRKLSNWLKAAKPGPGGGVQQVEKTPEKASSNSIWQLRTQTQSQTH